VSFYRYITRYHSEPEIAAHLGPKLMTGMRQWGLWRFPHRSQ